MNLIADEIANKTEPSIIYHKVVNTLQNARHEIALTHTPKEACYFGVRRDDPQVHQEPYIPASTALFGPYEEYNTKYIEQLTNILANIPHNRTTFEKTARVVHETVMGKKCSFKVELLDGEELKKREYIQLPSTQELHAALKIQDKSPLEIAHDYNLMKRLKLEQKTLYDRLSMLNMFCRLLTNFPEPQDTNANQNAVIRYEPKDMYVLGTLRLETEPNKMVCMARHLTWMYRNSKQDPVDRMRKHSVNYVIHQDLFLIERTQKACSQIFARVLAWDKTKSLDSLKDNIALLRFVYGNSMPCFRGDGAVGDWLELALYRHHGFEETKHNNNRLPCFELLATTSLSEYLKNYRDTISVK
ncbi:MAG TPA: hypothetical protein VLE95_00445 [Chlamydiales bacterium]|nr:hypothetical protein [Chlamydiales bacterium]